MAASAIMNRLPNKKRNIDNNNVLEPNRPPLLHSTTGGSVGAPSTPELASPAAVAELFIELWRAFLTTSHASTVMSPVDCWRYSCYWLFGAA